MNDALAEGNAFNVTEQSVKAMEAAYDVICLEPPTTQPPTTEPPTTQTTGSGEQDRINKSTYTLYRFLLKVKGLSSEKVPLL